jgi:hypothetical protein
MSEFDYMKRERDRKAFARAVFRAVLFGTDEMPTAPWPSYRCWEPRPREDLTHPLMVAQRQYRRRPTIVRHGPFIAGKQQPIRKIRNAFTHRYKTNEVN